MSQMLYLASNFNQQNALCIGQFNMLTPVNTILPC